MFITFIRSGMHNVLKSQKHLSIHFCVKSMLCFLRHTKIDTKHMSNKHYVVVVILIELQNDKRKEKARNWLYGRCCFVGPHEGEQQYVL